MDAPGQPESGRQSCLFEGYGNQASRSKTVVRTVATPQNFGTGPAA